MNCNRDLTTIEVLFAFHGRLGRLKFLMFNSLVGVTFLPTLLCTVQLASQGSLSGPIFIPLTMLYVLSFWMGAALLVKRLHDLGWSGLHAIWFVALWHVPPHVLSDGLLLFVLQSIAFVISFWLLLAPGMRGSNDYGSEAGATVDRALASGSDATLEGSR